MLEDERFSFDRIVSEAIADKIRAVERARKADELVDSMTKELEAFRMKQKLGL